MTLRNVGLLAARKLKAAISSPLVALGAAAPVGAAADNTDVWIALQGARTTLAGRACNRALALLSGFCVQDPAMGVSGVVTLQHQRIEMQHASLAKHTPVHCLSTQVHHTVCICNCYAGANDVLTLAKQRTMHRRHKSSGAALVSAARDKQHAASAGAHSGTAAAAAAAHLEHNSSSSGQHHEHLPHIHSSPSIPAVPAAAAAAPGGTSSSSRAQRCRMGPSQSAAGAADGSEGSSGWSGGAAAAGVFAFADADMVLEPGQSVTVPMWLHLQEAGRFEFQCVWFCEPQVGLKQHFLCNFDKNLPELPVAAWLP